MKDHAVVTYRSLTISISLAALLALAGCTSSQPARITGASSVDEALKLLPAAPAECQLASGPRIKPVTLTMLPVELISQGRSGWSIVRYSMKAGKVAEAEVVANSAGSPFNRFALEYVRNSLNPQAPDAQGCLLSVAVSL